MTSISQQKPINILKPLFLSAKKGSLICVLIGQTLISVSFRVFLKSTKVRFAFCYSVMSVHFGKQCRVGKYRLSLFFSKLNWYVLE